MNVHEYQSKEILERYGVAVLPGRMASTPDEAAAAARDLGGSAWVIKAQVHAGGRGKGGGVKLARSLDEVKAVAGKILGMTLVTPQTGPQGKLVRKVLVGMAADIKKEYYLGVLMDRASRDVVMMASAEGGVEIEKVAAETPDKIHQVHISPDIGFMPHQGRWLAYQLGLSGDAAKAAVRLMEGLYRVFMDKDCTLAEINPLAETRDGKILALDAKLSFDDNALFRHEDVRACRDIDEEDKNEVEASKYDLSYISLSGNIGCLVNGAGLAMATMDIIKLHGGEPANFLDVGGSATQERVSAAFRIIMRDPSVKAILVNIFGGIMRCDIIAQGIVAAVRENALSVPVVVRFKGTNAEEGKTILKSSGLKIIPASTLAEAAQLVTGAIR